MAKSHRDSVLAAACVQTPVNPVTRTPCTLYERKQEESQRNRHPLTSNTGHESERTSEDGTDSDSDTERNQHGKSCESKGWFFDISKIQNSDKEYYIQLEQLKNAHLQNMAQLERMYEQKLKLKGVQNINTDQEVNKNCFRSMWDKTNLHPAVYHEGNDFHCNVSSALSENSLSESSDGGHCSDSEESMSAREKIFQMWNDFSVDDYIQNSTYVNHSKEKCQTSKSKSKKWSHRITIPEPFQMTIRETKKKETNMKSKSEIELENKLLKKALEEEAECQKKFRANPVPASVYLPLYHEIVGRNEERRKFVKEKSKEILLASQKPFKFIEREKHKKEVQKKQLSGLSASRNNVKYFKAKPVPRSIYGSSAKERLKEEELYRDIRIHMRAQELLHNSSYPTSTLASRSAAVSRKTRCYEPKEEPEHKPKIKESIPNFEALHQKQHKRLLKAKHSKHVTVCDPFHLRTEHISHTGKIIKNIEADEDNLNETRWPYKSPRKWTPVKSPRDSSLPSDEALSKALRSTESSKKRQQAIRKSIEEKNKIEEEWKRKRARQKHKEKLLKKHICSRAKAIDPLQRAALLSRRKLNELRKQEKQRTKEYLQELEEMKDRVNKKPLLLERASQKNARLSAEKHYSTVLQNLGLREDFVSQKGQTSHLKDVARIEQHSMDEDGSEGTLELEDLQDDGYSYKDESEDSEIEDENQGDYSTDDDHTEDEM
ncbi:protein FAM161A [Spea bombifrons]|uniref:protein FAM161A n=1 Tax=Spea bombifrons TaxID=233779 RepID=UPI00234BC1C0|nr:protein FAM161A [Spea bombifrons]